MIFQVASYQDAFAGMSKWEQTMGSDLTSLYQQASHTNQQPATTTPSLNSNSFTSNLSFGSTGNEVLLLQQILSGQRFLTVAPTGNYGNLTTAAVKKFQTAHSIQTTGTVGPITRMALNQLNGSSTPSTDATTVATQPTFYDAIINNKQAREYGVPGQTPIIVYSFPDKNTLVITGSEAAFQTITARLTTSQFVQ
jgi:peptidoglycan hydrolase-like protein with peptidoglycan-binding domain